MDFFTYIEEQMKLQRVIPFPQSGLDYLKGPPPKNKHLLAFHNDLVKFIRRIVPNSTDVAVRQHIIKLLQQRIMSAFSSKEIVICAPCGSCLSGTFLPNADIDIALFLYPTNENPRQTMDTIMDCLHGLAYPDSFTPLPNAKVPVLKFSVIPGIQIDLSIDELHGPLSVMTVRQIFEENPCMLPAQLFLKTLLYHSDLDQPYTGGISSYTLQIMLLAYIQHAGTPDNITDLIIGFMHFYGKQFNFVTTGIDVKNHGSLFSREKENCISYESPTTMHIRDPLNPNNILGHNSFKMPQIRDELSMAYDIISTGSGSSYLARLETHVIQFEETQKKLDDYCKTL